MKLTSIPFFKDYYKSIKVSDTEETYDLLFSRPLGYIFAKWLHALGFNPNGISYLGMVVGVFGGFLLYWQDDIRFTATAFILVTIAGVLDSADGQAARLYNQKSENGRVLDAIMDNLVFISCYFFAVFHYIDELTIWGIAAMGLIAGGAHSIKSNIYEYYKGMYAYYTHSDRGQRNPSLKEMKETFRRDGFFQWLTFILFYDYVNKQNILRFRKEKTIEVLDEADAHDPKATEKWYRHFNKHLLSWWALTSGSNVMRNGILIFSLFGRFDLYCYLNVLTLIPYLFVGLLQNRQDNKTVEALKAESVI
jgi:phosphatidylglycerophosphate synthase